MKNKEKSSRRFSFLFPEELKVQSLVQISLRRLVHNVALNGYENYKIVTDFGKTYLTVVENENKERLL